MFINIEIIMFITHVFLPYLSPLAMCLDVSEIPDG